MSDLHKFIKYQLYYSLNNFDSDGLLIRYERGDLLNREVYDKTITRLFYSKTVRIVSDDSYYIVSNNSYCLIEYDASFEEFVITLRNPSTKYRVNYKVTKEMVLDAIDLNNTLDIIIKRLTNKISL